MEEQTKPRAELQMAVSVLMAKSDLCNQAEVTPHKKKRTHPRKHMHTCMHITEKSRVEWICTAPSNMDEDLKRYTVHLDECLEVYKNRTVGEESSFVANSNVKTPAQNIFSTTAMLLTHLSQWDEAY